MKKESTLQNAQKIGEFVQDELKKAAESLKTIGDVRGKGLMIGVELIHPNWGTPHGTLAKGA
jgi:4-aminobutyrate aminotransferase